MVAHSSTDGKCANYLTNLLFCQVLFPDSLLEGARRLPVDAKARQRWKALGDQELAARARQAAVQSPPLGDGTPSSTGERKPEGEAGESSGQEHARVEHSG